MDHVTVGGNVAAFVVTDGKRTRVASSHNTLSYVCADIVASMFAGDCGVGPKTVAFVYATQSGKEGDFKYTTGERNKGQADIVQGSLAVHDVTIDPNPQRAASSSAYSSNVVKFNAMTTDNSAAEYMYGFILKDGSGANAKVLAVKKLDAGVLRPAGSAMAITWSITFT